MKFKVALIICLLSTTLAQAQNLTGIWRGNFYSGIGLFKEQSRYEVQINQRKDNSLRGVTYSYKSTVFYGKARLKGIYRSATSKEILLKEDTLLEMRSSYGGGSCLFTCYLTYNKQGNTETLEGTYSSETNDKAKNDCGSGTIYLERVTESDFTKEDFLLKKPIKPFTSKPNTTPLKPTVKPTTKDSFFTTKPVQPVVSDTDGVLLKAPIPPALQQRENELVKTLTTSSPNIKIELYDNGEIDGDTITVYHNNKVIAYKKQLSNQPITLNLLASKKDTVHELVMYADNLGRIPPNTALMVVTTGGKRYEIFITSSNQKNAKVIIQYDPASEK